MMPRLIRRLGIFVVVGLLLAAAVYARADGPKPVPSEATAHLQRLQTEQMELLDLIQAVAVDNPANWSFVWLDQAKHIMQGGFPGFDAPLGNSLIYTWYTKLSNRFHEPGDYLPLFILHRDGSEARIALYKHDGSIQVIRMVPDTVPNRSDTDWHQIDWEVTVREIR